MAAHEMTKVHVCLTTGAQHNEPALTVTLVSNGSVFYSVRRKITN